MTLVRAINTGYFGGVVREPGAQFDVPDDLWADKKRRPRWAEAVKFGGKGDHDGDGNVGGSKPADDDGEAAEESKGRTKGKGKGKGETVEAPTAEPFADAPAPGEAKPKGNGVEEALGTEPDWVAPKPID